MIEDIPNDSAAALVLLEHHWAVPLRDAIVRAGGFRISDGFISPFDLVEIGLVSAKEAEELHAMEPQGPRPRAPRSGIDEENGGSRDAQDSQSRAMDHPAALLGAFRVGARPKLQGSDPRRRPPRLTLDESEEVGRGER